MTHSPVTCIKCSAGSGPNAFEATALTKTKNGTRQAIKTRALSAGLQEGGIEINDAPLLLDARLLLIVAGKVHAFIEASDLLTIAIEHLRSNAIGVEE